MCDFWIGAGVVMVKLVRSEVVGRSAEWAFVQAWFSFGILFCPLGFIVGGIG